MALIWFRNSTRHRRTGDARLAWPLAFLLATLLGGAAPAIAPAEALREIAAAETPDPAWNGPRSGPAAVAGRNIVVMADDLRNGGVVGVAQGMREAAAVLGWTLRIVDAGGTQDGRRRALAGALAMAPDGLVLCGTDALANQAGLAPFALRGLPVVGWHAAAQPGAVAGTPVAMNVSTDPLAVARVAAMAVVAQSAGRATPIGVVIFTDSSFRIATAKSEAMAEIIRGCVGCTLLEVRDMALADGAALMPAATADLLQRHGAAWTHALAINDLAFDDALPTLVSAGVASDRLSLVSAGDGSPSAFLRIRVRTFQTATVAEPLNQQGWQLLDELNRLFAGWPVSGVVSRPHLVDRANIPRDAGAALQDDPDRFYRGAYRQVWQR